MCEKKEGLALSLNEFIGTETTDCLEELVEAGIDSMPMDSVDGYRFWDQGMFTSIDQNRAQLLKG